MRGILIVLLVSGGTYLAVCALAFLFQKRLVFFPDRQLEGSPARAGLAYEDVFIDTEDGERLHAWLVPAEAERGVVLFCHGNAGNISHRLDTLRLLHDLGLTCLAFDYRGYGRSTGGVSEAGTRADARAAWRYLVEQRATPPASIVVFGRSLGAAVAIELATAVEPGALIVESAFTSVADMATRAYPWLPVRWLLRLRYESHALMPRIRAPKLIVHSRDDDVVPFEMGRRLFDAATDPKWFLEIHGPHNAAWMLSRTVYEAELRRFLARAGLG